MPSRVARYRREIAQLLQAIRRGELSTAKVDDLFNRHAADGDLSRDVLDQNLFHGSKVIGFIIHGPAIYFNVCYGRFGRRGSETIPEENNDRSTARKYYEGTSGN